MRPRPAHLGPRAALLALLLAAASASSAPLEVARPGAKAGPEAGRSLDRALYRRVAEAHRGAPPRRIRQLVERIRRTPVSLDPALLPQALPLLPATDASQRAEQAVIDEGIARTRTAKELYLYLERQTSVLRGSARPEDQALAGKLVRYLAGYKESWAGAWLAELYARPASRAAKPVPVRFGRSGEAKNVSVPLPLLPATQATEADVQRVIDAGIAATRETPTPKALFVYLEGQVHELRARGERPLAKKLTSYLGRYRKQWTASWLGPGERAQVRAEVKGAGSLLARLADQALLRRMPETSVLVSPFYSVSGVLATEGKRRTINIVPSREGTTRDTLHELGHIVEDADLRAFARVHGGVLRERAFGTAPQPLATLLPGTTYGPDQRGLAGGYLEPYIGRYYPKGWTEVLSMGLERLAKPTTALDFFKADGWHCLVTLSALRR